MILLLTDIYNGVRCGACFLPRHFIKCAFDYTHALRIEIAENSVPCRAADLFNAAKFDGGVGDAQLMPVAKCTILFEITKERLPPPGYGMMEAPTSFGT